MSVLDLRDVIFYRSASFDLDGTTEATFMNITSDEEFNIDAKNTDVYNKNVIWVEGCYFGGDIDFGELSQEIIEKPGFLLKVENDQKAVPEDDRDTPCHQDYKGDIMIKNNYFGLGDKKLIDVANVHSLKIVENTFEVITKQAIFLGNIKKLEIKENKFQIILNEPIVDASYTMYKKCSVPSLPAKDIRFEVSDNKLSRLSEKNVHVRRFK